MGLMGMFGSKENSGNGVGVDEWGSDMVGMMKMLGGMPGMMRKPMMKGRINQLLALTEEGRQESIREMFGAFHSPKINDKTREKLITTRVELVGELPEGKRNTIIASRLAALKAAPELEEADRKVQERVLSEVSPAVRKSFTSSWEQLT